MPFLLLVVWSCFATWVKNWKENERRRQKFPHCSYRNTPSTTRKGCCFCVLIVPCFKVLPTVGRTITALLNKCLQRIRVVRGVLQSGEGIGNGTKVGPSASGTLPRLRRRWPLTHWSSSQWSRPHWVQFRIFLSWLRSYPVLFVKFIWASNDKLRNY